MTAWKAPETHFSVKLVKNTKNQNKINPTQTFKIFRNGPMDIKQIQKHLFKKRHKNW